MKILVALVAAACLSLGLPTSSSAQIKKVGNGYLLRMQYTKGQVIRYKVSTTGMGNMAMNMDLTMKVVGVSAAGVGTVEYTISGLPGGQSKPQVFKVQMDRTGKVVGGNKEIAQMTSATLPNGPVKVGQVWTSKTTQSGLNLDTKYKFNGLKGAGAKQVAVIAVTLSGSGQGMKMSAAGSMTFLVKDGSLNGADVVQTLTATGGNTGGAKPIKMNTKVVRR